MRQAQTGLYFSRATLAYALQRMGGRLAKWAAVLDDAVNNAATQKSRELRSKLEWACKVGVHAEKNRSVFDSVVRALRMTYFSEGDLLQMNRWERRKLGRALWKTAREAHPQIAYHAMIQLNTFTPKNPGSRPHSPQRLIEILHRYSNGATGVSDGKEVLKAVERMRHPSAVPYLLALAKLGEDHAALSGAASRAIAGIERMASERG